MGLHYSVRRSCRASLIDLILLLSQIRSHLIPGHSGRMRRTYSTDLFLSRWHHVLVNRDILIWRRSQPAICFWFRVSETSFRRLLGKICLSYAWFCNLMQFHSLIKYRFILIFTWTFLFLARLYRMRKVRFCFFSGALSLKHSVYVLNYFCLRG